MTCRKLNGFTLIELLIVVAILAIMAASSLAIIVEPMKEHARVNVAIEQEAGFATMASQIIGDAHDAAVMKVGTELEAVVFMRPGSQEAPVYFVDSQRNLRRAIVPRGEADAFLARAVKYTTQGAALIPFVEEFTAAQTSEAGSWELHIRSRKNVLERELLLDRRIPLTVGTAWMGARP